MQVINDALMSFRDDVASGGFPGAAFSPYKISQARPKPRQTVDCAIGGTAVVWLRLLYLVLNASTAAALLLASSL